MDKNHLTVLPLFQTPLEDVVTELPGDSTDDQARWLEAKVRIVGDHALRMCNLYLPNGNPTPGPKYDYKLWMHRLYQRAKDLIDSEALGYLWQGISTSFPNQKMQQI